jgi:hypothetical protein
MDLTSPQTVTGTKTFDSNIVIQSNIQYNYDISYNKIYWKSRTDGNTSNSGNLWNGVAVFANTFLAVGNNSSKQLYITSTNNTVWASNVVSTRTPALESVACFDTKNYTYNSNYATVVALASGVYNRFGSYSQSASYPLTWGNVTLSGTTNANIANITWTSVCFGGIGATSGNYVAVGTYKGTAGNSGVGIIYGNGLYWNSSNAANVFYSTSITANGFFKWNGVCWAGNTTTGNFIAVGNLTSADSTFIWSKDCINWYNTSSLTSTPTYINYTSVCYSPTNGRVVAVSNEGVIYSNTQGGTWDTTNINIYPSNPGLWQSVCWSNTLSMFVAVGTSQGSDIMYSLDGLNWIVTSTGTSSQSWTSVIWSDTLNAFALVGTSGTTILSSGFFAQFVIGDNITANTRTYDTVDSTSSSTGALVISGGVGISGNLNIGQQVSAASFNATSDVRVKSNIVSVHISPEYSVDGLKPVSYFNDVIGRKDIGFIAQDVEEIYPFMVNDNADGYKSLSYTSIIGLLVKEIQILKSENQVLKGDLQDLKIELQDLKQKVAELLVR